MDRLVSLIIVGMHVFEKIVWKTTHMKLPLGRRCQAKQSKTNFKIDQNNIVEKSSQFFGMFKFILLSYLIFNFSQIKIVTVTILNR